MQEMSYKTVYLLLVTEAFLKSWKLGLFVHFGSISLLLFRYPDQCGSGSTLVYSIRNIFVFRFSLQWARKVYAAAAEK